MRVIVNDNGDFKGYIGDVTNMKYSDGSPVQVGDLVETHDDWGVPNLVVFIIKSDTKYYPTHGGFNCGGKSFKLIKKFYDIEVGDNYKHYSMIDKKPVKIITIDGEDIEISIESFEALKRQLT